jgi:hypothetical protein
MTQDGALKLYGQQQGETTRVGFYGFHMKTALFVRGDTKEGGKETRLFYISVPPVFFCAKICSSTLTHTLSLSLSLPLISSF